MINNNKLLNIILPSTVIGSYFSYNKHFRNNLQNNFKGEITPMIDTYKTLNNYNKKHYTIHNY